MSALLACFFFLAVAFNTYYAAKRQGRWSWPQFVVVVVALIVVPITIVVPLMHMPWLQAKPGLFTLIATSLIILFVCALAYILKKCWPLPHKRPAP
jgi:hypothetical protein